METGMRITVQAIVEGAAGQAAHGVTIGVIERDADAAPDSGLGLFVEERNNCDFERISYDPERIFCEQCLVEGIGAESAGRVTGARQSGQRMP